MSKNLDETVRLQFEKKTRVDTRNKRDYKGLRRARVALPISPAHQPRRYSGETSVWGPIVA